MIRWHRLCAALCGLLLGYVVLTGAGIQFADIRALLAQEPATEPDMVKMREHLFGAPNYVVVSALDYSASPLPVRLDAAAAMRRTAALARAAAPGAALRMVELRMVAGRLVGSARMGDKEYRFDILGSSPVPAAAATKTIGRFSLRDGFKAWHQSRALGHAGTAINALAGIALAILMMTGLAHYARVFRSRANQGATALFWRGGGWWRSLHRWTALVSAILIAWIAITGIVLSADNLGAFVNGLRQPPSAGPNAFDGDFSSPIADSSITSWTQRTLEAFDASSPRTGIKVLQLRVFARYPQGVVVAADKATSQRMFNAITGKAMTMSEPGYPAVAFPLGWEWHQRFKQLHRGDTFGMTGRWLDAMGAVALLYMLVSGTVMYAFLWRRRHRAGRSQLIWR